MNPTAMDRVLLEKIMIDFKVEGGRIDADIAAGAPIVNPDGTFHLIKYLNWLLKRIL